MSKEPREKGMITEQLPNSQFRVELEDGRVLICYVAGKLKFHSIRLVIGDRVEVTVDKFGGKATNRIEYRL